MINCIYINNTVDDKILSCILKYLEGDQEVFFIVDSTDHNIKIDVDNYAIINAYHIINKKYDGNIVFVSTEDFMIRSTDFENKNKILVTTKENLIRLNKNTLDSKTTVLIFETTKKNIRKAKNAELQSILR